MEDKKKFYPQYNADMAYRYWLGMAVVYGYIWTSCKNYWWWVNISLANIWKKVWLSRRHVIRLIDELKDLWFIDVENIEYKSSIYYVTDCNRFPCCDDYNWF